MISQQKGTRKPCAYFIGYTLCLAHISVLLVVFSCVMLTHWPLDVVVSLKYNFQIRYWFSSCCKVALRWQLWWYANIGSGMTAQSHYLSQCWPRSMLSYSVMRPVIEKYIGKVPASAMTFLGFLLFFWPSKYFYWFLAACYIFIYI